MSDDTRGPQGRPYDGPVDPVTGAPVAPDWTSPAQGDQPGWPAADGTPTLITPASTEPALPRPTSVDPTVLPPAPPLPVAPSWGSPSAAPPAAMAPPAFGSPSNVPTAPGAMPPPPQYAMTPGVGLPGVGGWGAVPQAPKPGVVPLRPLGVGEILDGAISYIRRDPKTVLGVSALIAAAIALLQLLMFASFGSLFDRLLSDPALTSPSSGTAPDTTALATGLGAVGGVAILVSVVSFLLNVRHRDAHDSDGAGGARPSRLDPGGVGACAAAVLAAARAHPARRRSWSGRSRWSCTAVPCCSASRCRQVSVGSALVVGRCSSPPSSSRSG